MVFRQAKEDLDILLGHTQEDLFRLLRHSQDTTVFSSSPCIIDKVLEAPGLFRGLRENQEHRRDCGLTGRDKK